MADQSENQEKSKEVDELSSVTSTEENFSILSEKTEFKDPPAQRSVKNIFWATDQIGAAYEIDGALLKTHLGAFFLLLLFMIILIVVIHSEFNQSMYDMNSVIDTRFGKLNFTLKNELFYLKNVQIFEYIYSYLEKVIKDGPWLDLRPKREDPIIYLMGVIEIRQVRIQPDHCEIDERIENSTGMSTCYGEFEPKYEEKKDMPTKHLDLTDQQLNDNFDLPYKYQEPNQNIPLYHGKYAVYPPGGYTLSLTRGQWGEKLALKKLKFLKNNNWLDRRTRAIFLDAVLYCPNTNIMSSVKLVFEISPAGGTIAMLVVRTARIFPFVIKNDFFILSCIAFCSLCIVYFFVEEIREMFYFRFEYFIYFSSLVDLGLVGSYVLSMMYFLLVATQVNQRVHEIVEYDFFIPFEDIIINKQYHSHFLLITLFFSILKITRYFPRFGILHLFKKSVKQTRKVLVWAAFLFFFVNCVFVHTGFVFFGDSLEDYSTIYHTCITIIRYFMFMGNYRILWETKPLIGTIYFTSFIVFNFWLQGKFLLIIIYQTYLVFHTRLYSVRGMVLYRLLCGLCAHFRHKRKLDKIIGNMCKPKEHLTLEDINTVLKVFGFTKLERDLLFKMYDVDLKSTINANELPLLICGIIKSQVEDYQKHVSKEEQVEKKKHVIEREDDYTPIVGVEVISTELNRLEAYMDTLEEQVDALNCYFSEERFEDGREKKRTKTTSKK